MNTLKQFTQELVSKQITPPHSLKQRLLFNKIKHLKELWFILFALMFSLNSFSQSITITDHDNVEVGMSSNFTATVPNLPTGYTIEAYQWDASQVGSNGSVNGEMGGSSTIYLDETDTISSVPIMWDGSIDTDNDDITVSVWGKTNEGKDWDANFTFNVLINEINWDLSVTGDNTIQKCCRNNIVYKVEDYGSGNRFTWTYPSGWSVVSGTGTDELTLKPDVGTGGTVSCTVGRSQAIFTYTKNDTYSISRYNPSLGHYLAIPYPICPGDNFSLNVTALCGASYYNWSLPAGWQISSGQGTHTINVHITNSPQNGTVSCTASFTGGCSTSISRNAAVLSTTPPAPTFNLHDELGEYDLGYHCGKFNVRPANGGTRIEVNHINGADTYHWTVSAPWRVNPVYSSYPWTTITGPSNAPNSGTVTVRAVNCIGAGAPSSQVFYREKDYWCTHAYPCYCYCCQPPGDGGHPYPLSIGGNDAGSNGTVNIHHDLVSKDDTKTDVENMTLNNTGIYPNPNTGKFTIFISNIVPETSIKIVDIKGALIKLFNNVTNSTQVDMNAYPAGIYFVTIYNQALNKTLKLIKQ